jgi:hypothetical protein
MNELTNLFNQYYSDKGRLGYGDVYEIYFRNLRDSPITLLELGVWQGASLRAWHDYFPNATIAGLDNQCFPDDLPEGIVVHAGLQNDKVVLDQLVEQYGGFDIVVDDCSHMWLDQQESWEMLWKHIKPGGYYVIEDLGTSLDHTHDRWHRGEEIDTLEYLSLVVREVIGDHQLVGPMEFIHFYPNICVMKKRIR